MKDIDRGQTPQHKIYIWYKVLDIIRNDIVMAKDGQVREEEQKDEQKCTTLPTQLAWCMVDRHSYLSALSTTSINL